MIELGQVAYDAYCNKRGWKSFNGDALPQWHDQGPDLRDAWNAAAEAVGAFYNDPPEPAAI